jgi:type VI secretion system protein VasD
VLVIAMTVAGIQFVPMSSLRCFVAVILGLLLAAGLLSGCAATKVADDALGDMAKNALEAAGLRKPDPPALPQIPQAEALHLPRKVALEVYAGPQLNHDDTNQPLSVVLRIYQLKSSAAFLQAPYEAFAAGTAQKEFLGDDVVGMREVTLVPGQHYQVEEKVPREAAALGVVALFNAPAAQRWRFAFDTEAAEKSGVVMGAHGCALTVTQGKPLNVEFDASVLGNLRCGG